MGLRQKSDFHPLKGIRVVSLALNLPGPLAAAELHALGAQITKLEPAAGDPLEVFSAGEYARLTVGQKIMRAELKTDEGQALLGRVLADADLLLTSSRPRSLESLKLDWKSLKRQYPRLSHVEIVGYAGDEADVPGHDLTYQARAGLLGDHPCSLPLTCVADISGAQAAVNAALGCLLERQRTGSGAHIVVSLEAAAETFALPYRIGITAPGGVLGGGLPEYAIYPAKSGWVAVAALEPHFKERLLELVRAAQGEQASISREALVALFKTRNADDWEALAKQKNIPLVRIRGRER